MIVSIDGPMLIEVPMAWQLVSEVAAFLNSPGAEPLTSSERLALMLIAERANVTTRRAWESSGWSLGRTLGVDRPRKVLEKLASRDLEVRVRVGMDAKGKPVFAFKGTSVTYCLPFLISMDSGLSVDNTSQDHIVDSDSNIKCVEPVDNSTKGAPTGAAYDQDAPTGVPESEKGAPVGPKGAPTGAPLSSVPKEKTPLPPVVDQLSDDKREESQKRGDLISKETKADNQSVVQTILNMPGIRTKMSRFGEARLRVSVEACQRRGISDQQMISVVAEKSFDGVRYLERTLTARLDALEVRTLDTGTKLAHCSLHGHSDALHCPSCWGIVKAGGDPYEGCDDVRPEGWHSAFAWSPSVKNVTADEITVEPLNLPPAITAMLA